MKVRYGKGVTTHTGPESCVGIREDVGEALTGDCIGQPLSRERFCRIRVLTPSPLRKAMRLGAIS